MEQTPLAKSLDRKRQTYLDSLHTLQWRHHDEVFATEAHLFREDPTRRNPPVFREEHEEHNVLAPSDLELRKVVLASIPASRRQTWFGSMKSSQALTQSVFGTLVACGRLDCLAGVVADDGGLAFGPGPFTPSQVSLEHSVGKKLLGEPRPTNIDVWMAGPHPVCVECKFTEAEVGPCSRPTKKHQIPCNGDCAGQPGREYRCALAHQGIPYWDYIPDILPWRLEENAVPCRLLAPYQLVRNVLAACVENGHVKLQRGHALLVYDNRNPAFRQAPGDAVTTLREQLVEPNLLRRVSWQRVIAAMTTRDDQTWLVEALREKYGLVPEC